MHPIAIFVLAAVTSLLVGCGGGSSDAADVDISVFHNMMLRKPGESRTPSGSPIYFRFMVRNVGADPAADVRLQLSLGANLNLVRITCDDRDSNLCPSEMASTMVIPSLPAGGFLDFDVEASEQTRMTFDAIATLSASAAGDRSASNDSRTVVKWVWVADLSATYSVQPATSPGGTARFVATLRNHGPDTVYDFNPQVTFPSGVDAVFEGCQGICDWAAPYGVPGYTVPPGADYVFTYSAVVPADGMAAVSSTFSVDVHGDPDPSNNAATATTLVGP